MKQGGRAAVWMAIGWFAFLAAGPAAAEPPKAEDEPPRIVALLETGWAAESGRGMAMNPRRALMLYCRAGTEGSPEGYFRLGRLLVDGPAVVRDVEKGRGYLALAAQLGHEQAASLLSESPATQDIVEGCADFRPAPRERPCGRACRGARCRAPADRAGFPTASA